VLWREDVCSLAQLTDVRPSGAQVLWESDSVEPPAQDSALSKLQGAR